MSTLILAVLAAATVPDAPASPTPNAAPAAVAATGSAPVIVLPPLAPTAPAPAAQSAAGAASAPQPPTGAAPQAVGTARKSDPGGEIVVSARVKTQADPLMQLNAKSYEVIQKVDDAVVAPVAHGYQKGIPGPIRSACATSCATWKSRCRP